MHRLLGRSASKQAGATVGEPFKLLSHFPWFVVHRLCLLQEVKLKAIIEHSIIARLMRFQPHQIVRLVGVFDDGSEVGLVSEQRLHFVFLFLFTNIGFDLSCGVPEFANLELIFVPEVLFQPVYIDFDGVFYLADLLNFSLFRNDYFHRAWKVLWQFEREGKNILTFLDVFLEGKCTGVAFQEANLFLFF